MEKPGLYMEGVLGMVCALLREQAYLLAVVGERTVRARKELHDGVLASRPVELGRVPIGEVRVERPSVSKCIREGVDGACIPK